jgi:predicted HicB family RNase H-like nuclease
MIDAERYAITVRKVLADGEELWRATVRELPDLAEFAETREEAVELALDAIETLKSAAREERRPFPEPIEDEEEYSGRVTLRMSKSMHRVTALRAVDEGVSLNSYIVECIARNPPAGVAVQTAETPFGSIGFNKFVDYAKLLEYKTGISTVMVTSSTVEASANSGGQFALGTASHAGALAPLKVLSQLREKRRTA